MSGSRRKANDTSEQGITKKRKLPNISEAKLPHPDLYRAERPQLLAASNLQFELPTSGRLPLIELYFVARWLKSHNVCLTKKNLSAALNKIYLGYDNCVPILSVTLQNNILEELVTKTAQQLYDELGDNFLSTTPTTLDKSSSLANLHLFTYETEEKDIPTLYGTTLGNFKKFLKLRGLDYKVLKSIKPDVLRKYFQDQGKESLYDARIFAIPNKGRKMIGRTSLLYHPIVSQCSALVKKFLADPVNQVQIEDEQPQQHSPDSLIDANLQPNPVAPLASSAYMEPLMLPQNENPWDLNPNFHVPVEDTLFDELEQTEVSPSWFINVPEILEINAQLNLQILNDDLVITRLTEEKRMAGEMINDLTSRNSGLTSQLDGAKSAFGVLWRDYQEEKSRTAAAETALATERLEKDRLIETNGQLQAELTKLSDVREEVTYLLKELEGQRDEITNLRLQLNIAARITQNNSPPMQVVNVNIPWGQPAEPQQPPAYYIPVPITQSYPTDAYAGYCYPVTQTEFSYQPPAPPQVPVATPSIPTTSTGHGFFSSSGNPQSAQTPVAHHTYVPYVASTPEASGSQTTNTNVIERRNWFPVTK